MIKLYTSGADPDFQVRGGALKKIAPSGGRRENLLGISCEKSRFYAKKSYFSNFRGGGGGGWGGGAREIFGVFHVKNHDFTPKKNIFFPILGAPPLNPPLYIYIHYLYLHLQDTSKLQCVEGFLEGTLGNIKFE